MIFHRKDIFNYLEHLKIEPKDEFFEPCDSLQIVLRMTRNLGQSFEKLGETERLEEIKTMLEILQS
jgi:hypothetical protein